MIGIELSWTITFYTKNIAKTSREQELFLEIRHAPFKKTMFFSSNENVYYLINT